MKLISFRRKGRDSYGVVTSGGIVDVGRELGDSYATLGAVLRAGALDAVRDAAAGASADVALDAIEYLPPITDPPKIVCIGLNYKTHIEETGRPAPEYPILFPRYPDSHVGNGEPMVCPKVSDKYDFEGELAFVIGKEGRHIAAAAALDYVAGYSCYNDGSIRDYQRHTTQFMPGKTFWRSGAFGPCLVTTDELPDPGAMTLLTRLNGEEMQRTGTDDLLFGVPELIEYMSAIAPIQPGDVISTGTTGGVGFARKPPVWMKAGDTIEVEISGIGTLTNPIIDE
jgi:2-keto-4-pentenoate hydratase/2-oxohepta-3-ene-1,7-dioic acid hydratase in catechol pathway